MKKSMQQQEICQLSVIWRGRKFSLEMDPTATLKSLGDDLLSLTNVRDDTMRLIVPTNKSSRLLYPFSEEHSCLKLEAASILEGKSIRMLGVPKDEVDDILQSAKADLRIVGFDEEEKRMGQRISNGLQSSLKLPQGPYVFCDFRALHLPGIELNPPASKALKLMHKLAADPGIVAIMNKHRWRVGIMTEMAPEGYVGVSPECILGFNKNHGEEISLRLRTDDLKGFRKYDSIKKTLLHELAHMVHSEHDVNFYALLKQLNEEAAKLDWTKSKGHTLSGGHNSQHYEDDKDNDNLIGLSHKLGGQTSVFNARASSVTAAYSRLAQASTKPSEAIEMHQASNAGDSVQSNHIDVLLEKQLNVVKVESLEKHNGVFSADVPSDDRRKSEPDPDDCETGFPMKHEPHIKFDSDKYKMRGLLPPLEAKLSDEPDPDDCSAEKHNTVSPTSLEPDPDEHIMGIEKKVTAGQSSHVSLGHHVNEEERKLSDEPDPDDCSAEKHNTVSPTSLEPDPDEHIMGIEKKVTAGQSSNVSLGHHVNEEERKLSDEPDPDDCSAEKHNTVSPASLEPDPDEHITGIEKKVTAGKSSHVSLGHYVNEEERKLSDEPDLDDCSAEKHNTVSPASLEPDPDEHIMGIEKKVTAGQSSHVSLGHHVNEEERRSLTHTNQDGFPEGVKLEEPYTNDKDIIPDGVSSTVIDEPDPDDQELQRIQDPVSIICSRLQKAVDVLRSQANPLEASRVVQTILKIIRNAIEHPDEVKFRKLRKANPLIQRDVVSYPAAMDILSVIGFSEDAIIDDTGRTEAYLVLKRNDPGLLWLAKSSLETSMS